MYLETMFFFVETLLDIGFHTLSLMNSTYPSIIWDKSSASYANALAKISAGWFELLLKVVVRQGFLGELQTYPSPPVK
jgi:hypothetical protein